MSEETITINGVIYSRSTGLAIGRTPTETAPARPSAQAASNIHQHIQRSKTLNRNYVSKRQTLAKAMTPVAAIKKRPVTNVQRSTQIRKFAPHPVDIAPRSSKQRVMSDISPAAHPIAKAVQAKHAQKTQTPKIATTPKPSDVLKREAIANAMNQTASQPRRQKATKQKQGIFSRFATLASAGTALLLIGGYFTYLNMPNLSMRVAAAQAGIDAQYPSYRPSGYSLSGPIAYDQDKVSMKFAANGGPHNFTILQSKSGWDSQAVLDNYVQPKAGKNYLTNRDSGLTIYTFGDNAAWVSGGILYTINGDAPLSIDQIRRIATSM